MAIAIYGAYSNHTVFIAHAHTRTHARTHRSMLFGYTHVHLL